MWAFVFVAVMASLTTYYRFIDKEALAAAEQVKADNLAESMTIYRDAVVSYFKQRPTEFGTVGIDKLIATKALPDWSTLFQKPAASPWTNYRHDDGVIYIYATVAPSVNASADIVRLSQNSVLAGIFRTGDTTLHSPVFGDTKVTLPPLAKAPIPNGSPVWIAMSK
jgi:hypothetical protein